MANDFWFKFRFKDWKADTQPLSLKAKGLLIELIIYLRSPGVEGEMPVDIRLMSRLSGGLTEEVTECITEFEAFGIFDFVDRGAAARFLISRGIKKELAISLTNSENGSKGGNPKLRKKGDSVKRKGKRGDNRTSVSVSYSDSDNEDNNGSEKKQNPFKDIWKAAIDCWMRLLKHASDGGKFGKGDGTALIEILERCRIKVETNEPGPASNQRILEFWQTFLGTWDKWEDFHKQPRLPFLNQQFDTIYGKLKSGKTASGNGLGTSKLDRDELNRIAEENARNFTNKPS